MSAGATKNWPFSAEYTEAPTPLTSTASTIVSRFVIEGCSPKREIDLAAVAPGINNSALHIHMSAAALCDVNSKDGDPDKAFAGMAFDFARKSQSVFPWQAVNALNGTNDVVAVSLSGNPYASETMAPLRLAYCHCTGTTSHRQARLRHLLPPAPRLHLRLRLHHRRRLRLCLCSATSWLRAPTRVRERGRHPGC